jgi:tetratricopeptide (TPR) repeat protein
MAQRYGDYQEAERLMQEGLALARSLPDDDLTSELLQGLGVVAVNRGEYEAAEGYFQEGLALAQMTERPARISALLANLGTLRFSRGDYAGAEKHFLDGLSIAREADLPGRISALLTNLGVLAARGQYEVAEHYFRSLSLAEALGHRENVIFLLDQSRNAGERARLF